MHDRFYFRVWCGYDGTYFCFSLWDIKKYTLAEINPDDIEQCTGLKDKNGKLIYEGDIVKTDSGSIYYIKWDKKTSSFREEDPNLPDMAYKAGHHLSLWADIYCKSYTIIGNIHENPELLK